MRTYEIPDHPDSPPDDEPEGKRVKCWNCGGDGVYPVSLTTLRKCPACGGTGYTCETTEDETEEAENED